MKKFAIVLSGCGVYDGAEIHEAVMTMLAVMKHGASYEVFAPDMPQHHVINHLTGKEMKETRNVLVESARIARGRIRALGEFRAEHFDALIFPGGFGAAKNLCDFAFTGPDCTVHPDVKKAITSMENLKKPIGALCIAPVILARLFGDVELTIGQDKGTATAVEKMGAKHVATSHGEVIHDRKRNLFTTPCYMLDANILQIEEGSDHVVEAMLRSL